MGTRLGYFNGINKEERQDFTGDHPPTHPEDNANQKQGQVPLQRLNWFLSFQNVTANHRANDVIAAEDGPQVLVGRFMYGPLDMVALTGEKVQKLGPPYWVPDGTWAEGCMEGLAA